MTNRQAGKGRDISLPFHQHNKEALYHRSLQLKTSGLMEGFDGVAVFLRS